MKLLVNKENGYVVFAFTDDKVIVLLDDQVLVGNPLEFNIGCFNSSNAVIYENITLPEGWKEHKYSFDGTTWAINEGYLDETTH